jgi:hypothetical protein
MDAVKWYKSKRKTDDLLSELLINDIKSYYLKESSTDETKLYESQGYYVIRTTNFTRLVPYLGGTIFEECPKPARKLLSPM